MPNGAVSKSQPPSLYNIEARNVYLNWLQVRFSRCNLAGLVDDEQPISIKNIYVPLRLDEETREYGEPSNLKNKSGNDIWHWLGMGRHLLISGQPGSGKTTLVQDVVNEISSRSRNELTAQYNDIIPVPIMLREVNGYENMRSLDDLLKGWWSRVVSGISDTFNREFDSDLLRPYIENGKLLVILDGLDEVGGKEKRTNLLKIVVSSGLFWRAPHEDPSDSRRSGCIFVFTGRPVGFRDIDNELSELFVRLNILDFDDGQIRKYVANWYNLRSAWTPNSAVRAQHLIEALTDSAQLRSLAARPVFLSMMSFIHGTRGELPHTRAQLYQTITDAYLTLLDQHRGLLAGRFKEVYPLWTHDEKKEILSALAFRSHSRMRRTPDRWQGNATPLVWSKAELIDEIAAIIEADPGLFPIARPGDATLLTDYFLSRTGLLCEPEEGKIQFSHLSFQEYLTAVFLLNEASVGDKMRYLKANLLKRLNDDEWIEVGLLLLAIDATRTRGKGYKPILRALDIKNDGHTLFLMKVLSGSDIHLSSDSERKAWLAAACIACYVLREDILFSPYYSGMRQMAEWPENEKLGADLLTISLRDWVEGKDPSEVFISAANEDTDTGGGVSRVFPPARAPGKPDADEYVSFLVAECHGTPWWTEEAQRLFDGLNLDRSRLFSIGRRSISSKGLFNVIVDRCSKKSRSNLQIADEVPFGYMLGDALRAADAIEFAARSEKEGASVRRVLNDVFLFRTALLCWIYDESEYPEDIIKNVEIISSEFDIYIPGAYDSGIVARGVSVEADYYRFARFGDCVWGSGGAWRRQEGAISFVRMFAFARPIDDEKTDVRFKRLLEYQKRAAEKKNADRKYVDAIAYVIGTLAVHGYQKELGEIPDIVVAKTLSGLSNRMAEAARYIKGCGFANEERRVDDWKWVLRRKWSPVKMGRFLLRHSSGKKSNDISVEKMEEKAFSLLEKWGV